MKLDLFHFWKLSEFCTSLLEGIYWVDMTFSWVKNGIKYGRQLLCACCGLFERKEIEELLMMLNNPIKILDLFLCILL